MDPIKPSVRPSKFNDAESANIKELMKTQEKLQQKKDYPFSRISVPQRLNTLPPLTEQGVSSMEPQLSRKSYAGNDGSYSQKFKKSDRSRSKQVYNSVQEGTVPARIDGTPSSTYSRPWTQDRGRIAENGYSDRKVSDYAKESLCEAEKGTCKQEIPNLRQELQKFGIRALGSRDRMRSQLTKPNPNRPATQERQYSYSRITAGSRMSTSESHHLGRIEENWLQNGRRGSICDVRESDRVKLIDNGHARSRTNSRSQSPFNIVKDFNERLSTSVKADNPDVQVKRISPSEHGRSSQRPKSARYGRRPQTSHVTRTVENEFAKIRYSPSVR